MLATLQYPSWYTYGLYDENSTLERLAKAHLSTEAPIAGLLARCNTVAQAKSERCQARCLLGVDIVAKVFLRWRTKIPRAPDAFYAQRGEGDHIVSSKIDHAPP